MPKKLRHLVIDRVDLVDAGANFDPESGEGAHILLAKRDGDTRYVPGDDPYGVEDFGPSYRRALAKVAKSADPEDQLEQLAAAFKAEYLDPCDGEGEWSPGYRTHAARLAYATDIIMRSPRGRELVAEIRALKREQRPRSRTFADRLGRTHEEPTDSDRMATTGARIRERENTRPTQAEADEVEALLAVKRTTGRWH